MRKKINFCLIMGVIICLCFAIFYLFNNSIFSKNIPIENEVKQKKNGALAIMVSYDKGTNYVEYDSLTWPGDEYVYETAKCVDDNGKSVDNVIRFDEETNHAIVKTNKSIRCYLYFKYSLLDKLKINDSNKSISSELVGGMYRYQGVDKKYKDDATNNPKKLPVVDNNYICFGTNNKEDCLKDEDKYMYRIIGITPEGSLKIIKKTRITAGSNSVFSQNSFNDINQCYEQGCEWPDVTLFKRLNGTSNGTNNAVRGDSNIFINNSNYPYMVEGNTWFMKIKVYKWLYGDVDYSISSTTLNNETVYGASNNGLIIYKIETGKLPTRHLEKNGDSWEFVKYQWSENQYVNAKIGLMYLHDYYLAYDNERNWHTTYDKTNWILAENDQAEAKKEWLLSGLGNFRNLANVAWDIDSNGSIGDGDYITDGDSVRPVFYLNENVIILKGNGKEDNPYLIEN